jgi:hypothetical protein
LIKVVLGWCVKQQLCSCVQQRSPKPRLWAVYNWVPSTECRMHPYGIDVAQPLRPPVDIVASVIHARCGVHGTRSDAAGRLQRLLRCVAQAGSR